MTAAATRSCSAWRAAVSTDRPRVLVVEDNFMNKVLVREMLTLHGYEVIEAGTGKEAVELTSREAPDLILMDLHLPEMDGVTATRLIKEREELRMIPIVALTASAMKGDEETILSEGFDGYVPKPIELSKLLAVVGDALKRKDLGSGS